MIDLHALRQRLGGVVYAGGREWIGPGPGHSRKDTSLHVSLKDGRPVWFSFAGDKPDAIRAHLGLHDADYRALDHKVFDRAKRERERLEQSQDRRRVRFSSLAWQGSVALPGTAASADTEDRG